MALLLCLVAGSPPRIVGDGGEYLAMALNMASFHRPALASADIPALQQTIGATDSILDGWDIKDASFSGRDGRRDFLHFWVYPLFAVPALWLTRTLGVNPVAAFTITNLCLLAAALWVALPRLGPATCLLLFGGPIVWWTDKPHTEPFTFAFLTIAFLLVRERPWWSLVAAGIAATQNPPIGLLVVLIIAAGLITERRYLRDRRFLAGAVIGLWTHALAAGLYLPAARHAHAAAAGKPEPRAFPGRTRGGAARSGRRAGAELPGAGGRDAGRDGAGRPPTPSHTAGNRSRHRDPGGPGVPRCRLPRRPTCITAPRRV